VKIIRWGASSAVLAEPPTLLVYGGKTPGTGGQTYSSAPNSNDFLALDLSTSFDAASPPWTQLSPAATGAPPVSFHTFSILGNSSTLLFGGNDLTSSTPSGNNSAYLFNLPVTFSIASNSSSSSPPTVAAESVTVEPSRRMLHSLSTASNSRRVKGWLFGGLRSDGSGVAFAELWEFDASADDPGSSGAWTLIASAGAPPPLYGHTSTLIRGPDGVLRMYIIGGVFANNTLAPLETVYVFTPDLSSDTSTGGSWTTVTVSGTSGVQARQGHVAVPIGQGQILVHGGAASATATVQGTTSNVLGDMFVLTVAANGVDLSCSPVSGTTGTALSARYNHVAAEVGNVVLVGFGQ
jgi:hypothetical protein